METALNKQLKVKQQNLERRVKHHQFGAGGHDVVALVGFHKSHVNITLWFGSCEEEEQENTLRGGRSVPENNGHKHSAA